MIVTDSITSSGLKQFIENDLGGKHYRYRRGYKNVIDKALELNAQGINCPLAIETSGHAAMRENYFLDDGAYLCTKIIIKAAQMRKEGKELDELTASKNRLKAQKSDTKFLKKISEPAVKKLLPTLQSMLRSRTAGVLPMITVRASEFRLTGITVTAGSCSDFRYTIRLCRSMLKVTARAV